jgi:hypothetical protein
MIYGIFVDSLDIFWKLQHDFKGINKVQGQHTGKNDGKIRKYEQNR